jgi:phosphatidylserine/phosphatidylglycerophosphate/cardiolipin synthase-like enzyme
MDAAMKSRDNATDEQGSASKAAASAPEILTGVQLHRRVVQQSILNAEHHVSLATANLKNMHVDFGHRYQPILAVFDRMAKDGVRFRIVHGEQPSRRFRSTLEGFPRLTAGALELQICPRCHWKMAIVDGRAAYLGSANFTGAGLGAKSERRRNIEVGVFSEEAGFVSRLESLFDEFWIGAHCRDCGRREHCHQPILP